MNALGVVVAVLLATIYFLIGYRTGTLDERARRRRAPHAGQSTTRVTVQLVPDTARFEVAMREALAAADKVKARFDEARRAAEQTPTVILSTSDRIDSRIAEHISTIGRGMATGS